MKVGSWRSSVYRSFGFASLGLGVALLIGGCGGGGSGSSGSGGGGGTGGSGSSGTPAIISISPTSVTAGSNALTLTISGTGFVSSSVVQVGGTAEATTYVSATQLTATVPASQISNGAELAVTVVNGTTGSSGTTVHLEVDNPAPTITSISPASEPAGTASAEVVVTGTGFVPSTVINVNGTSRPTLFTSATQVSVTLTSADLAGTGNLSVTAVNPTPGGGTSTAASMAITAPNPVPTISALSPATETVNSASPIIVVSGTGFVSSTVIDVNGSARSTTLVSATQVSVTLSSSDLAATGSLSLTAVNPAPGGGTSAAVALPVNNPTVGALLLSPSSLPVGSATPTTITVTGNTFVPNSVLQVNGSARAAAYVNATTLTFTATVADQASLGTLSVTVTNPAPGGGTSPAATLSIVAAVTPAISSVSPTTIVRGSPDTLLVVSGTGFATNSVVQWNGSALSTALVYYSSPSPSLLATVPAADLTSTGSATVTVSTPTANPSVSNAVTVTITDPPAPALTSAFPSSAPLNTATQVTLSGTGFTTETVVAVNGVTIPSTLNDPTGITATIPASSVAFPGNVNITVTTPGPGGGTSAALPFTVYLSITANDIVYNATDGLIYASVPGTAPASGNSVVGIDPTTGNVTRQIWVGSNPNKLALSSDGTQLFVGLDGSAGVAQVNLTQGKVVNQFSLGGGEGVYDPPLTALYLAGVPGSPNSVVVATAGGLGDSGTGITIYDSGIPRSTGWSSEEGPMSFGSSGSTLYVVSGSTLEQLTVGSTGITAATALSNLTQTASWVQYDNGNLYLSSGQVVSASTGTLLGTFFSSTTTPATGPIVSDSSLGRAFVATSSYIANSDTVMAFDESTYNLLGSIVVNGVGESGYPSSFEKIVRWGQNGLAINATPGPFTSQSQLFIFQSALVKDLSSSPADLSVTLSAPSAGTTGSAISWVATVNNLGPNSSQGAAVALTLDPSLIINSVTASTGSCGTGTSLSCDLGTLANGATATVTVNATPTQAGTLAAMAAVTSVSDDPTQSNNEFSTSTTVTGAIYGAMPVLSSISPNLVQAGSTDFTLTVAGTGFNANSTVNLGITALATTYVSATQLTATVTAAEIANYGWQAVTVSNPMPGGGVSQIAPLTIYDLVNVPASGLLYDPYSQLLYATVPGTSTTITGNSIVSIDPTSGTVGTPISIGSQPTVMAETNDGNYLYVGLSGADSVAQFDLVHQSLKATIPLFLTEGTTSTSVAATWLATMPGNDTSLSIDVTNGWGQFGIFDISGSTGTFRPNLSEIYNGVNPVFANASELYAFDSQTSGAEFYRYSVNANGLTEIDGTTLEGMGGFSGGTQLANGLVYGVGGGIINPSTTPPSQVATLPLIDFYGSGDIGFSVGNVADPSLQKEFLVLENSAGTFAYGLVRYDLNTYLPETFANLPASVSTFNSSLPILRCGQDGLAMVTTSSVGTNSQTPSVLLLRGPFVVPQELGTDTAAGLTGSSASTIAHGSGNTILTLTGTNFLPGVAVTWNGSYRTTTLVDATHVTIAIPASDVATTGSASVAATNPGAPASNALTITIN